MYTYFYTSLYISTYGSVRCRDPGLRASGALLCGAARPPPGTLRPPEVGGNAAAVVSIMGWSKNHFNNLHFEISLETNKITTWAAEQSLRLCVFLKCRLLK